MPTFVVRATGKAPVNPLTLRGLAAAFASLGAPEWRSNRLIRELPGRVSPGVTGFSSSTQAIVVVAVICGGLALDQLVAFWGQTLTNAGVWALFLWWLRNAGPPDRLCLTACVVYATIGEIFLSLVWGLYDYRLANIPLFVPPGHALLFALGVQLAARAGPWIAWAVPLAALPFVLFLLVTGSGTLDAPLYALFVACALFGKARRLYAVMFVLALAMEIYGTWLGNWAWTADVPWVGLTSVNPPLAAGAFYCVLDMLVVTTVSRLRNQHVAANHQVGRVYAD